ncbi:MAG TPA: hypothetical protein VFQ61_38510, partial [Polyangiaceae bacterium]|nr:hypothetical protein [Polyangiaceae bacterium]
SLGPPVQRLLGTGSYMSPRLREIAAPSGATEAASDEGEILAVVSFGRVPVKIAQRVPIGLALTYASGALSPTDASRANYLAGQGLVTWVNYPELEPSRSSFGSPSFSLDGSSVALESPTAVDEEARRAWDDAKGTVVAAAITRMLSRVVAGEAVRQTAKDGLVGALLGLGVQATLTAADTPDTRSWQTLPARMVFGRARVKAGQHEVVLTSRGVKKRETVTVKPGGFAVVAHTVLF